MSTHIYYNGNHRRNLTLYWRQFYPDWQIPSGYHVHHINPKCTFADKNNPRINHPSNLIALHPDDHVSIHKCRGDKLPSKLFLSIKGRAVSEETLQRQRDSHKDQGKGIKKSKQHSENISKGKKNVPQSAAHKHALSIAKKGKPRPSPVYADTGDKIAKSKIGKKAFNNGIETKMFIPGTQLADFIYIGRVPG